MPTKVIDASAVAAILFNEPAATMVAKQVDTSSFDCQDEYNGLMGYTDWFR